MEVKINTFYISFEKKERVDMEMKRNEDVQRSLTAPTKHSQIRS
jgi:hypothetical protein